MARRIKTVPRGYEEVRKDGEQPEFFYAQHIIPFGNRKDLGSKLIGIFKTFSEAPDESEKLISKADSYADRMKAPFYELIFKKSISPKKLPEIFSTMINVVLTAEVQLYVHNKPARLK